MPRDLWYRIVYSQVLEQQLSNKNYLKKTFSFYSIDYLGSGKASVPQIQSGLQSPSKRKHKEGNLMIN
jgi:hypothetical protein